MFVCKYTGTPGVDEVLQGGNNPISVDWQPGRDPGQFFNDGQGRSFVLEFDVGQPEPAGERMKLGVEGRPHGSREPHVFVDGVHSQH